MGPRHLGGPKPRRLDDPARRRFGQVWARVPASRGALRGRASVSLSAGVRGAQEGGAGVGTPRPEPQEGPRGGGSHVWWLRARRRQLEAGVQAPLPSLPAQKAGVFLFLSSERDRVFSDGETHITK